MPLNALLDEAYRDNVCVVEHRFKTTRLRGLYSDGTITINASNSFTEVEKACIIAEELGHHHTTIGNILDQSTVQNRKQERRARQWAYNRLIPLSKIVQAYHSGAKNRFEIAEFMRVTEEFLDDALKRYQEIYELCAIYDRYVIYFDPLIVVEMYELPE